MVIPAIDALTLQWGRASHGHPCWSLHCSAGAVLFGKDPALIRSRKARHTYGVRYNDQYVEGAPGKVSSRRCMMGTDNSKCSLMCSCCTTLTACTLTPYSSGTTNGGRGTLTAT